ncbi:CBS domain-containing protein [Marinospirillum minutulum]|uniref:CBS domain-containing protein n=1 Tax=Marinospirillum minutulum TaxID=64974 RepID=UPI000416C90A|nr:CBS domain-containing protein [Marinospirillum minutulum]
MQFPTLESLATRQVISLDEQASLADALALMNQHAIRSLLVCTAKGYRLLQAKDLMAFHLQGVSFNVPLAQVLLPRALCLPPEADIQEAIKLISLHQAEQVCLVDANNQLCGIVTYTDLVQNLDPDALAESQRLGDLLRGMLLLQVNKEMPVSLVLSLMQQQGVNTALISENRKPLGILTLSDVMRLLSQGQELSCRVEQVMSSPVDTLPEHFSVRQAVNSMREKSFKRLVVVNDKQLVVGLISQQDLVNLYYSQWFALIKKQQQDLLENNQRLEQKNQVCLQLLEALDYPALLLDAKGQLDQYNQATQQIFGKEKLVPGTSLVELMQGNPSVANIKAIFTKIEAGQAAKAEVMFKSARGYYQAYQLTCQPLENTGRSFMLLSFKPRQALDTLNLK